MSRGHFDYEEYKLLVIIDELQWLIDTNNSTEVDAYGYEIGRNYGQDTLEHFSAAIDVLKLAYVLTKQIDYLVSGEDKEETFHERVSKEILALSTGTDGKDTVQ